jgi:hypothetical protein
MKIHPVGAELLHVGGAGGHDEADSRISEFCKGAYNQLINHFRSYIGPRPTV